MSGLRILRDLSDTLTPLETPRIQRIVRVHRKHRGFIALSIKPLVETPVANCFIAKELSRLTAKTGCGFVTHHRQFKNNSKLSFNSFSPNTCDFTDKHRSSSCSLGWEPPRTDLHEMKVYSFNEILRLLKVAQSHQRLPHSIFRLFGMLRYFEIIRITDIHQHVIQTYIKHSSLKFENSATSIGSFLIG